MERGKKKEGGWQRAFKLHHASSSCAIKKQKLIEGDTPPDQNFSRVE